MIFGTYLLLLLDSEFFEARKKWWQYWQSSYLFSIYQVNDSNSCECEGSLGMKDMMMVTEAEHMMRWEEHLN